MAVTDMYNLLLDNCIQLTDSEAACLQEAFDNEAMGIYELTDEQRAVSEKIWDEDYQQMLQYLRSDTGTNDLSAFQQAMDVIANNDTNLRDAGILSSGFNDPEMVAILTSIFGG